MKGWDEYVLLTIIEKKENCERIKEYIIIEGHRDYVEKGVLKFQNFYRFMVRENGRSCQMYYNLEELEEWNPGKAKELEIEARKLFQDFDEKYEKHGWMKEEKELPEEERRTY